MKRTQTMVDKARHRILWIEQHDPHRKQEHWGDRKKKHIWGRRGRDRMVVDFTTTYSISAYHHLFVRSNPAIGDLYSIQHYVIQFVRDFGRSPGTPFSTTNKTDCHYLGEILVKVMLNTIILSLCMRLYILK